MRSGSTAPHRSGGRRLVLTGLLTLLAAVPSSRGDLPAAVEEALGRSGSNRPQLEDALKRVPAARREGLEFLLANMPPQDLASLKADFLLEHVAGAYEVMEKVQWGRQVPKDIFLNNVLPYPVVNERRDAWRRDFQQRFLPLVADCANASQAAARLNQKVFPMFGVHYSTGRPKADQSPYESIEAKKASCTGLSILLVAACRSVGVPARFAGIPVWPDRSGNHSWVEVWDGDWHFTGAAEPAGDALDQAWFAGKAAGARRDEPAHAIYAVSFQKTPLRFPLVFAPHVDYVSAYNVTDRYTRKPPMLAPGEGLLAVNVREKAGGARVRASVRILAAAGTNTLFEGSSRDEGNDSNDWLTAALPTGVTYRVEAAAGDRRAAASVMFRESGQKETLTLDSPAPVKP